MNVFFHFVLYAERKGEWWLVPDFETDEMGTHEVHLTGVILGGSMGLSWCRYKMFFVLPRLL